MVFLPLIGRPHGPHLVVQSEWVTSKDPLTCGRQEGEIRGCLPTSQAALMAATNQNMMSRHVQCASPEPYIDNTVDRHHISATFDRQTTLDDQMLH